MSAAGKHNYAIMRMWFQQSCWSLKEESHYLTTTEENQLSPLSFLWGLQRNNTPSSGGVVQVYSPQNNEPVVLSSVARRSPGRLQRQLWWDPGIRARTREGGAQQRGFIGEQCEVTECSGPVCCGNLWIPAHPHLLPPIFSDSRKGQSDRAAICNADHVQEKEARNQWSCINLLTANVLYILILDPFPTIFWTNSIVLLDSTFLALLY